jgi:hypothetical protein
MVVVFLGCLRSFLLKLLFMQMRRKDGLDEECHRQDFDEAIDVENEEEDDDSVVEGEGDLDFESFFFFCLLEEFCLCWCR